MTVSKGNIVKGNNSGRHGIVLAVRKDGTRAKVYEYGPDREVWVPLTAFTVEVAGLEQCYKCLGSGLYYMGGAVVNGRYTGKTGICFACEGKGQQSDADRVRCHYYWHRQVEAGEEVESPLEPAPQQPLPQASMPEEKPAKRPKIRSKSSAKQRKVTAQSPVNNDGEAVGLIDCNGCGTLHREDTICPW
jgi:hypothetical protein